MIEKISAKLLTILAADSRLYAGGNSYAPGWTGVKRESLGDTPTAGYVNLFDKSHDPDGVGHSPGIYVGTRGLEATDDEEFEVQSGTGRVELRLLTVPLYITCLATDKYTARKMRNQLRRNVKVILMTQIVVTDYWYGLEMPGGPGSITNERVWTTATGGGTQQSAEGIAIIPVRIHYSWNPTCDA